LKSAFKQVFRIYLHVRIIPQRVLAREPPMKQGTSELSKAAITLAVTAIGSGSMFEFPKGLAGQFFPKEKTRQPAVQFFRTGFRMAPVQASEGQNFYGSIPPRRHSHVMRHWGGSRSIFACYYDPSLHSG
jgi:hypothetical protein